MLYVVKYLLIQSGFLNGTDPKGLMKYVGSMETVHLQPKSDTASFLLSQDLKKIQAHQNRRGALQ